MIFVRLSKSVDFGVGVPFPGGLLTVAMLSILPARDKMLCEDLLSWRGSPNTDIAT